MNIFSSTIQISSQVRNIFCPTVSGAWGDNIINVWASEYIKYKLPNCKIYYYDHAKDGNNIIQTSDFIQMPWVTKFCKNNDIKNCDDEIDTILYTHHRHSLVDYSLFQKDKHMKIFFDAHGIYLKFIKENWYPSFVPQRSLIESLSNIKLPENYNVIHHGGFGGRNPYTAREWSEKYKNIILDNTPMISTGTHIDGTIDLSKLNGWQKLYVMINAKNLYVSQSGFTSVASIYRKRKDVYLLGINEDSCHNTAPPIQSYSNVNFEYDLDKAYYYMEKRKIIDYLSFCKSLQPCNHSYKDMEVFPTFDGNDCPEDFKPKSIYINQENAPVTNLKTTICYVT